MTFLSYFVVEESLYRNICVYICTPDTIQLELEFQLFASFVLFFSVASCKEPIEKI